MVVFVQSGSIRTKEVVFGQKRLDSGKVVGFWQSGCIWAIVVLFAKWLLSGKSGSLLAKVVVSMLSGCIWAKVVVFGQSCCIRARSFYSGNVVVFGQIGCFRAKWCF